jgi:hypothetical protein
VPPSPGSSVSSTSPHSPTSTLTPLNPAPTLSDVPTLCAPTPPRLTRTPSPLVQPPGPPGDHPFLRNTTDFGPPLSPRSPRVRRKAPPTMTPSLIAVEEAEMSAKRPVSDVIDKLKRLQKTKEPTSPMVPVAEDTVPGCLWLRRRTKNHPKAKKRGKPATPRRRKRSRRRSRKPISAPFNFVHLTHAHAPSPAHIPAGPQNRMIAGFVVTDLPLGPLPSPTLFPPSFFPTSLSPTSGCHTAHAGGNMSTVPAGPQNRMLDGVLVHDLPHTFGRASGRPVAESLGKEGGRGVVARGSSGASRSSQRPSAAEIFWSQSPGIPMIAPRNLPTALVDGTVAEMGESSPSTPSMGVSLEEREILADDRVLRRTGSEVAVMMAWAESQEQLPAPERAPPTLCGAPGPSLDNLTPTTTGDSTDTHGSGEGLLHRTPKRSRIHLRASGPGTKGGRLPLPGCFARRGARNSVTAGRWRPPSPYPRTSLWSRFRSWAGRPRVEVYPVAT